MKRWLTHERVALYEEDDALLKGQLPILHYITLRYSPQPPIPALLPYAAFPCFLERILAFENIRVRLELSFKENPLMTKIQNINFEAISEQVERHIKKSGLCVISTATLNEPGAANLSFSYSVGLSDKEGCPEIITFGLPPDVAKAGINEAAKIMRENDLPTNLPVEKVLNMPVYFLEVDSARAAEYMRVANWRANKLLPAVQMVWPDVNGNYPWSNDFDKTLASYQPVLYGSFES